MEMYAFETALGFMGFLREDDTLHQLAFGHPSQAAVVKCLHRSLDACEDSAAIGGVDLFDDSTDAGADPLVRRLHKFASGEATSFGEVDISLGHLTPFGKRVIESCRQIPWGETLTYGQLATNVGHPGAARAVGSVMANNRVPLVVPCHRVVPSCGGLGGFSAPQGVTMKRRLLDAEKSVLAGSAGELLAVR